MNEELNFCVIRNVWVIWFYKSDFLVSKKNFFVLYLNFFLRIGVCG